MQWMAAKTNTSFLAQELSTGNIPGLIGIIVCSCILAILYEAIRFVIQVQEKSNEYKEDEQNHFRRGIIHAAMSALHIIRVFTGYILMLAAVTYNVWVIVTICISAGIGYYIVRSHFLRILCRRRRQIRGSEVDDQLLFYKPADDNDLNLLIRSETPNPDECWVQKPAETSPNTTQASAFKTSLHEMNSNERWVFIRETFQRASKRRLKIKREQREAAREQMGGINDTFGTEDFMASMSLSESQLSDSYVNHMPDLRNDSITETEENLTLTMYITVV